MNGLKQSLITLCLFPAYLQAENVMIFSTIENSSYATISKTIMDIAYKRLKVDISVLDLPAERAVITANSGTVDGELYRIKNIQLKYKNLIMIPVPIGKLEGIAISQNKSISMNNWEELSGHRVCFRRGVKFAEKGLSNITARVINSNKQLMTMLEQKRCDIIVIARITSIPLMNRLIESKKIELYYNILQTYPLYHYLHKKNSHLVPQLTKVLNDMQREGIIDRVRSQFINAMIDR